jgi:hypothetical protein
MSWKCANCEHFNDDSFERCDLCNFKKKESLEIELKSKEKSKPKEKSKLKVVRDPRPKSDPSPLLKISLGRDKPKIPITPTPTKAESAKSDVGEIVPKVIPPTTRIIGPVILILLLLLGAFTITVIFLSSSDRNSVKNANSTPQPATSQTLRPSTPIFIPTPVPANSNTNSVINSSNCQVGDYGDFTGGFFRSYPKHSVDGANVIAIVEPDAIVKILSITTGEPRKTTGNTGWYKVEFTNGTCQFDPRNSGSIYDCEIQDLKDGYVNADLVINCR